MCEVSLDCDWVKSPLASRLLAVSLLQWQPCADLFSPMIGRLIDSESSSSYFHFCSLPSLLLQFIFPFILSFSPLPLLCHWILFDRKYSRRCGVVVDLALWQTVSIRLICIHKSIGYLTLANTLGSRERRCWVGQVTLSLVMELWWSVTALHSCWLTGWKTALKKIKKSVTFNIMCLKRIYLPLYIY